MAITIRENAGTCSGLEPDLPNKMSVWCDAWTPGVKFPVSRASTASLARPGEESCCGNKDTVVPCSRIADTSISGDLMNVMRGPHDADFLCVQSSDNTLDRALINAITRMRESSGVSSRQRGIEFEFRLDSLRALVISVSISLMSERRWRREKRRILAKSESEICIFSQRSFELEQPAAD